MCLQFRFDISNSFLVFELSFPPITIIMSEFLESSSASFCLSFVALHIVSKTRVLLQVFFTFCTISPKKSLLIVVCATIHMSFEAKLPSISLFTSLIMTALLSHQPFIPIPSGWFLSPTIII